MCSLVPSLLLSEVGVGDRLLGLGAMGGGFLFSGTLYMGSSGVTALRGLECGCGFFWTTLYICSMLDVFEVLLRNERSSDFILWCPNGGKGLFLVERTPSSTDFWLGGRGFVRGLIAGAGLEERFGMVLIGGSGGDAFFFGLTTSMVAYMGASLSTSSEGGGGGAGSRPPDRELRGAYFPEGSPRVFGERSVLGGLGGETRWSYPLVGGESSAGR